MNTINIDNRPFKSNQEIFDEAFVHLFKQNCRSVNSPNSDLSSLNLSQACRYRDEYNNKCAVGIFIPDDRYNPGNEGSSICKSLHLPDPVRDMLSFQIQNDEQLRLLRSLQECHDSMLEFVKPENFRGVLFQCFLSLSNTYKLNTNFIEDYYRQNTIL